MIRLSIGWTSEVTEFDSRQGQINFSLFNNAQTETEVHITSYTMGTGRFFSRGKETVA
jgi:hypothetical protein